MASMRHPFVLASGSIVCAIAFLVPGFAIAATPPTVTITVSDVALTIKPGTVPAGTVAFTIRNAGKQTHTVTIAGFSSGQIKPGLTARVRRTYITPGTLTVRATTTGHAGARTARLTLTAPAAAASDPGRAVFVQAGCGGCHTLRAANAAGIIGPDFDVAKPSVARIVDRVTNGYKGMPPFGGSLTSKEIADVAAFVYASTH